MVLDFDRVIEEMKSVSSPFLEVWIVAFVRPGKIKVVRVAPSGFPVDSNMRDELGKAMKQTPFLKRGIRGTDTECRDLGPAYLPIRRKAAKDVLTLFSWACEVVVKKAFCATAASE
jgi:hypothetical protein